MSKTNIARFARKGACGSLSVMRTVCEPTAATALTTDLSSKPPNCPSQYSNVWPAFTWLSCWGWAAFHHRSKFHTTAAASSGLPSWNFTLRRSWNVHTRPSLDTSHFSASAGSTSVVAPLYRTRPSKTCRVMREEIPSVITARSEEHTSELQSRTLISYAVFCLKKKNHTRSASSVVSTSTTKNT